MDEPHPAGGGEVESFDGAVESVRWILPSDGDLAGGDVEAGKLEEHLTAMKYLLRPAEFGLGIVEVALGQGAPAQNPVAAGDVSVPMKAPTEAAVGQGPVAGQSRVTASDKQFRPPDAAIAVEFFA